MIAVSRATTATRPRTASQRGTMKLIWPVNCARHAHRTTPRLPTAQSAAPSRASYRANAADVANSTWQQHAVPSSSHAVRRRRRRQKRPSLGKKSPLNAHQRKSLSSQTALRQTYLLFPRAVPTAIVVVCRCALSHERKCPRDAIPRLVEDVHHRRTARIWVPKTAKTGRRAHQEENLRRRRRTTKAKVDSWSTAGGRRGAAAVWVLVQQGTFTLRISRFR